MRVQYLAVLLVSACASVGSRAAERSAPPSFVVVQNDRSDDVWIHVVRSGVRTRRLGMARGLHSDTLSLVETDLAPRATLQFVAIGVLSGAVEQSNDAVSERGASYQLHLGSMSGQSFLFVRPPPRAGR
jgi:hypothetical protein